MGRFVTPQGVEFEMEESAARAVGYRPAEAPKPAQKRATKKAEASAQADDK